MSDVAGLAERPEGIIELSKEDMFSISLEDQRDIQLAGARKRFSDLVEKVPVLGRLAEEQGISEIRSIEDMAPLLVPHSAMKSYPMSVLEKNQFDRLTRWLDGFTTYDLSTLDASGCECIDDWIDLLDTQSELRIFHSTGTTGKLSFVPRDTIGMKVMLTGWIRMFDTFRDERPHLGVPVESAPTIFVQYRYGGMGLHRLADYLVNDLYGGNESMLVTTHPGRLSADVASIGGRLRVAEAKGELGSVQISPRLMEKRDQFLKDQQNASAYLDNFFETIESRFKGQPVSVIGSVPQLHSISVEAKKRGVTNAFREDSFIQAGGGMKGHVLPDDWRQTVDGFLGGAPLSEGYGMSEMGVSTRICPHGHYHIQAWQIPFLLDPQTGNLFPRTGTHVGRYGCFDLNAQTYWGGFLTGDRVTLSWGDTEPCPCGRVGPYVHPGIRRYSEAEGGDDKITCAGAPQAHDRAIDFILESVS